MAWRVDHAKFHLHRCRGADVGPTNLTFLNQIYQNINAGNGRILCTIVTKFSELADSFNSINCYSLGRSVQGFPESWGLKLRRPVTPKFSAPPSGETIRLISERLEVQESARGPLSPCQVRWVLDFACHQGSEKC